ncbi:hypothetical protein HDU83_008360 [Entophlyctis luteolus]|nr:hypothetical protein HDU83_008360 [Entophlyctis luteolus]
MLVTGRKPVEDLFAIVAESKLLVLSGERTFAAPTESNSVIQEISLPDSIQHMQKSGRTILAADANTYKLINERSGVVTPSFPYDRSVLKPLVCVISNAEFLVALGTPQGIGLGMFVNANGDAIRGIVDPFFKL